MTQPPEKYSLVFDVGKTHVKLHLLNQELESVFSRQMTNRVLDEGPYPHFDVDNIWAWLIDGVREVSLQYDITAFTVTTHGATAALINRHCAESVSGLVLPVMDYEYSGVQDAAPEYSIVRPSFEETLSPKLPAGLNLGRQLHWLQICYPEQFSQATDILMYPQYWAWKLTGQLSSEVTSLGCHTDLWSIKDQDFSSLVHKLGWGPLFPKVVPGWAELGNVLPEVRRLTGLSESCRVFTGIHDSNASFSRYLISQAGRPFTVISTGTWSILMASGTDLTVLDASRDMLANVDVTGNPVACARFMGGREFEAICAETKSELTAESSEPKLQSVIEHGYMAFPDFSGGSGPFGGRKKEVSGGVPPEYGFSLATLYCALMLDYQLDMLNSKGDIFVEGAFLKNKCLCSVLAQLRGEQTVWLSADATGTVQGCAHLADWDCPEKSKVNLLRAEKTRLKGLDDYRSKWRRISELASSAEVA